jgi:hypothetical protein
VHQAAHGEVGEQEAVAFLTDQVGRLAAQDHAGATQVGFELIEGRLNLPCLSRR